MYQRGLLVSNWVCYHLKLNNIPLPSGFVYYRIVQLVSSTVNVETNMEASVVLTFVNVAFMLDRQVASLVYASWSVGTIMRFVKRRIVCRICSELSPACSYCSYCVAASK
jgi:hypothetical protein